MFAHNALPLPTVTLDGTTPFSSPLTYSRVAYVDSVGYQAYQQKTSNGLFFLGSYYTGMRGQGEKYLGGAGGLYYYILPNGDLYRFNGTATSLTGSIGPLASLGTKYYNDPNQLLTASPPTDVAGKYTALTDSLLGFTPDIRQFAGTLHITATTTDGIASSSQSFDVIVTNNATTLQTIVANPAFSVVAGVNTLNFSHTASPLPTVTMQVADADGVDGLVPHDFLTYGPRPMSIRLRIRLGGSNRI